MSASPDFKNSLFGCLDKGLVDCLMGFLCPCYVGGMTNQKLNSESWVIGCLLYILCRPCYALSRRGNIREKYKIEGSCLKDCLTCCLCPCCAILQEAHEVDERGSASAPTGQAMG